MTAEEKTYRRPGDGQPPPPFVRIIRFTGGTVREGPWHDLEPAGWTVHALRSSCGARARMDHYEVAESLPAGARRCPRCRARARDRAGAS